MTHPSLLVVTLLLVMLGSYAICGIPFGLLLGRTKGTDPRCVGSKNIGATNVTREISIFLGALTALLDALKGFLCTYFGIRIIALVLDVSPERFLPSQPSLPHYAWVSAFIFLAAVLGHVFSPYLKFRGGKGIAVGFGAALGFSWQIALGLLVVWALCAVPTRFVSVGSIAAATSLPFLAFFIYYPVAVSFEIPFILIAVIVVWAHRKNLMRLRRGLEPTFTLQKNDLPLQGLEDPVIEEGLVRTQAVEEKAPDLNSHRPIPEQGTGIFFGSEPQVKEHIHNRIHKDTDSDGTPMTSNVPSAKETTLNDNADAR